QRDVTAACSGARSSPAGEAPSALRDRDKRDWHARIEGGGAIRAAVDSRRRGLDRPGARLRDGEQRLPCGYATLGSWRDGVAADEEDQKTDVDCTEPAHCRLQVRRLRFPPR